MQSRVSQWNIPDSKYMASDVGTKPKKMYKERAQLSLKKANLEIERLRHELSRRNTELQTLKHQVNHNKKIVFTDLKQWPRQRWAVSLQQKKKNAANHSGEEERRSAELSAKKQIRARSSGTHVFTWK